MKHSGWTEVIPRPGIQKVLRQIFEENSIVMGFKVYLVLEYNPYDVQYGIVFQKEDALVVYPTEIHKFPLSQVLLFRCTIRSNMRYILVHSIPGTAEVLNGGQTVASVNFANETDLFGKKIIIHLFYVLLHTYYYYPGSN